jgi:ornithine cyclodeaminase
MGLLLKSIDKDTIENLLDYPSLIDALREGFTSDINVPVRHHHDIRNPKEGVDSTLLIMPAWEESDVLGVKLVTVSPNNTKYNLPSINGLYLLFDAHKGEVLAVMDAKALTAKRTAAASALASSYLSRTDSRSLLMVGTGNLSCELILAHATVRPITTVYVWGRDLQKAENIADQLRDKFAIEAVQNIADAITKVDIISCATLSREPLISGERLQEGQHIDLVGSFKPDMREADDDARQRADIYIDTPVALKESGDLIGVAPGDIRADLSQLAHREHSGRSDDRQITLFKSVGHALEDLVAAKLVKEKLL